MKWLFLFSLFLLFGCIQSESGNNSTLNESFSNYTNYTSGEIMKAEKGDMVEVMYLGTLENGSVFDTNIQSEAEKTNLSNKHFEPLRFKVGAGQMIAGFDKAVVGMSLNEEKTVSLPPSEAYGERREDLVFTASISNFNSNVSAGMKVRNAEGYVGTITKVENDMVTIDFNPDFAGKTLIFKIILVKIEKA